MVTSTQLALACSGAIALLGASALAVARAVFAREAGAAANTPPTLSRRVCAVWLVMLFLLVVSAKFVLMRGTPSTAPYWDQWDAEAAIIFMPFHASSLTWSAMFSLHNEHRVLFTRLLALALLELNGQWDPRLEQVVNAVLHSFTAVLVTAVFWLAAGRRHLDLLVLVSALCFALPFAWENTLIGVQNVFYFLPLFSLLALWLITAHRPGTVPWSLGWLCAISAIFTAASGVVAGMAVVAVVALKAANDRGGWRDAAVNTAAAAAVLALGFAVAAPPQPHHAALKARNATDFLGALMQNMAWPWIDIPRLVFVAWLPVAALVTAAALRRARTTGLERLVLGLACWVVLQAGGLAYVRGAGAAQPATRYLDILSFGFIANVVALVALLDRARPGTVERRVALGALVCWLLFAIVGVDRLTNRSLANLDAWRPYFAAHATNIRRFLHSGDVVELTSKRPIVDLPYPDANKLVALLQDPYVRSILPAAVRLPLRVEPRVVTNDAFVTNSPYAGNLARDALVRSWWSLPEQGKRATGRFESQLMACQLGRRLEFEVAGYLGWEGNYLAVRNLRTGREMAVMPGHLARERWAAVVIPCPRDPFSIVGIDETDSSWFAFREPVEIGPLSLAAEALIRNSREPFVALLAVAVLALAVRWT
jgi:hypothetical protein